MMITGVKLTLSFNCDFFTTSLWCESDEAIEHLIIETKQYNSNLTFDDFTVW